MRLTGPSPSSCGFADRFHPIPRLLAARCVLCLSALTAVFASGLTLVREGEPTSVIVTNGRPREAQTEAASELQEHLRIMTGATIPIVKENELTQSAETALILVGQSNLTTERGVDTEALEPETFVIKTQSNTLILAGDDGGGGKNGRTGTSWAVYDFLQDQLGCRWLWPGEIGRVVPRRRTVEVADLDIRETPVIKQRHLYG